MEKSRILTLISAVLLLAVFVFAATLVLQKSSPHIFKPSKVFRFYMRRAHGVEVGTPVWVNGLDAGEVTRLELEEVPASLVGGKATEGQVLAVRADARIYSPFHGLLREGSQVEVLYLSVLGRPRIHVFSGPSDMPEASDGKVLSQRITRGIEGKAEEYIDRSQRVGDKVEALAVYLETLESDTNAIDERYKKGKSTLKSLLKEGEDREALLTAGDNLDTSAKSISEVVKGIEEDMDALGKDPFGTIQADFEEAGNRLEETREEGEEGRERWKKFFRDFERLRIVAVAAVDGAKNFHLDLSVLLEAKDRFVPAMDADRKRLQRDLFALFVDRLKVALLEDPREEEVLRSIGRGRLNPDKE